MLKARVIPVLLLSGTGLVKTTQFSNPNYLGDPINILKIFNEKLVDEVIILDIKATRERASPNFDLIEQVATECFMPVCYGGGVNNLEDMKRIFGVGIEKIAINSYAAHNPSFITQAATMFGSQSIVISVDVRETEIGTYQVYTQGGSIPTNMDPVEFVSNMVSLGAGEILLNSIDRDGMMGGYDIQLVRAVSNSVDIPVIACGGAGSIEDLSEVVYAGGASAAACGSLFVYQGKRKAVLISYPSAGDLEHIFGN